MSSFSLMSGVGTFACGMLPRRLPVRFPLALVGALLALGALLMTRIGSAAEGCVAAAVFGLGIGGMLTLLPVAWADYFGRENYGAIRGLALSAQVLAQAIGRSSPARCATSPATTGFLSTASPCSQALA